jgi:hypothetical protein
VPEVTAVRLTAAQAKKLGVFDQGPADTFPDIKPPKKRTTRRTVKGAPYFTICKACGMEFRTVASEDRHLNETRHARYELVLGH